MNIVTRHLSRGARAGPSKSNSPPAGDGFMAWPGEADREIWLKGPELSVEAMSPMESLPPPKLPAGAATEDQQTKASHHRKRSPAMRRTAAKYVLAAWMIVAVCVVTACSQAGSIKGAVGSAVSSVAASVTHPASLPAAPTHPASTAAETTTAASPDATTTPAEAASPTSAPAPATATTPAEGTSSTSYTWLWILLGAVALIGLIAGIIAWVSHSHGRRTAATAERRQRLIDAYARGAALH